MPEMAIQTSEAATYPLTYLQSAYSYVSFAVAWKWPVIAPASWAYRRLIWAATVHGAAFSKGSKGFQTGWNLWNAWNLWNRS